MLGLSVIKRWRVGLLGLVISFVAIYFITSEIDFALLGDAIGEARWGFVIPCIALLVAGLVTRGLRWRMLLSGGLPFWRAFHIMNVAYLVNGVLPLRIGEVARMFLANRADPPVPVLKTASTIIVERLLDLLAVVMMVALALAMGPVPSALRSAGLFMGVAGLGGFLLLVLLSRQRRIAHLLVTWILDRVSVVDRDIALTWLDHFLDGLLPLARLSTLLSALTWTAVSWSFSVAAGFILMYTFFETASLPATFLYIAAAALAIAVPATVGSLGVYEASIIFALEALGYGEPYANAVAFAITVHLVNVLVHSVTGVVGFVAEGVSLEQLSDGVKRVKESGDPSSMTAVASPTEAGN